jgi:endonuclease-3
MESIKARALEVCQRLLDAYGQPEWRNPLPALDELVSTILSQNTNDVNRDRAFASLQAAFPTWEAVRDAEPDLVIAVIRTAGLANQKGPSIQRVLQQITQERGELDLEFLRDWPADEVFNWLTRFKGVGPKTASIVMLFSLDKPAFPVDTHVYRVTGRLGIRAEGTSEAKAHRTLAKIFPEDQYYAVHLNLIRHGREVCHARNPECERCVLKDICVYYLQLVAK